jgi:HEAT repeat protein
MTPALTTLTEQLRHLDRDVRGRAALDLGNLGDTDAVASLIDALADEPDFYVREDITWALVRMREAALMPLMQRLQDASPTMRHLAAHTLSKISDSRSTEALVQATQDADTAVAAKAIFALGQIGDVAAIPALVMLLSDERREVQTSLNGVLERFGSDAIPALSEALHHERWQVREHAADTLGMIGSRAAVPALIDVLHDDHWQVRFAAVTALGHVGGLQARKALQTLPEDTDERVRTLVPKVLRRMR